MLGESITQVSWPKCGEIDVLEHINLEPKINGTIHWDNSGHAQYGGDTACDVKNIMYTVLNGIIKPSNGRWMVKSLKMPISKTELTGLQNFTNLSLSF